MNNLARFHGGLTASLFDVFDRHQIRQFDIRFTAYEGFHLIDIWWDIDMRRHCYRQSLTFLEVHHILASNLDWKTLAKEITKKIEDAIVKAARVLVEAS